MKFITKLFLGWMLALSAVAAPVEITVYDMNSKGNPGSAITETWIQALEKQNYRVNYRTGLGCAGRDLFINDRGPSLGIVFTGRLWASLQSGEDQCVVDFSQVSAVGSYEYDVKLCTRSDSGLTAQDLKFKNLKIAAAASVNPHGEWIRFFNQKYNTQHTPITAYKNSGAVAMGVLSGDADFGLISALTTSALEQENKLTCVATTNLQAPDNMQKLFPKMPAPLNNFAGVYGILSRNISDRDLKVINKIIRDVGQQLINEGKTGLRVSDRDSAGNKKYIEQSVNKTLAITKK